MRDVVKWTTTPQWPFNGIALKCFIPGPDDQNRLPARSRTLPLRDAHARLSINEPRALASTSARLPRPVRSTLLSPLDDMDAIERIVDGVKGEFHTLQSENETLNARLARLEEIHNGALRTVKERNGRIGFLENQLAESKRSYQEQLARLRESHQDTLEKRDERIDDVQNQLDESTRSRLEEEAKNLKKSRAHTEEVQSLREELRKGKESHVSEVNRIEARHKATLDHQKASLDEDHTRELERRQRDVGLQLERKVNGFLEVLGKRVFEFEAACPSNFGAIAGKVTQLELRHMDLSAKLKKYNDECTILRTTLHDRDAAIHDFRLRLEEANRRENDLRKEKYELNTKWLSTRAEGEERERELRDAKKCIESLRKELKMTTVSMREKFETQKREAAQECTEKVIAERTALEAEFKLKARKQKTQAKMTAERDAMGIRLSEIQLQLRDPERELTNLQELHKREMEQFEVITRDKDRLLTAAELQKTELTTCQEQLRTEIAGLKQAFEQERQAAREVARKLE